LNASLLAIREVSAALSPPVERIGITGWTCCTIRFYTLHRHV